MPPPVVTGAVTPRLRVEAPEVTSTGGMPGAAATFDAAPGHAEPLAEPGMAGKARNALMTWMDNRTNVTRGALSASRLGVRGAGLVLGSMPVVGSVLNAASALLSAARAAVSTAAYLKNTDKVEGADVAADWARLAADVAGVFFPPARLIGTLGSAAYMAYDAAEDRLSGKGGAASNAPG